MKADALRSNLKQTHFLLRNVSKMIKPCYSS